MKVIETRTRSLLKAISFRVIEVALDTAIIVYASKLVPLDSPHYALSLALILEGTCFGIHYLFERIWNKIDFGRKIK